ncbi:hypothetical protein [Aliamphritea ceti]|uniref:hypothetical protein n=1 Tax=Aliamphritea ceti TaxID=1524258 RepID=UPI0021C3F16C|nr:hypothetical protein [Aliamphritea ceti]
MDSAIVYNLPWYSALFILVMFPAGALMLLFLGYAMDQGSPGYRSVIPSIGKLLWDCFTYVRVAVLLLLLIQTLIWVAAPVESSFFTKLDLLFSQKWISAIYST